MSGICGIIAKDTHAETGVDLARRMVDALPESESRGFLAERLGPAAFAAFDPLSGDASGMLFRQDELLIACDGEFYNWRELQAELGLASTTPTSFSEAACLAALYRKSGVDGFSRIRGPFSALIYDHRLRTGFTYTDRIGIKPIYWTESGFHLIAATRLKSVLQGPGIQREWNNQGLYLYLQMECIPAPYTAFKGVNRLESGHRIQLQGGGTKIEEWWRQSYPSHKASESEVLESSYRLTKESVAGMLDYRISGDAMGGFLSGGTDSSTVAGLWNEINPGQAKTFSIGFAEEGYDEMEYARIAAKAFRTRHTEYYVTPDDILESLPQIVKAYDEPYANSSVIPTYFCAKIAHDQGVRAMLGGDGGDEIFGGNKRYHEMFAHFQRFPGWVNRGVFSPIAALTPSALRKGPLLAIANYVARSKATLPERVHAYGLHYYFAEEDIFNREFLTQGPFVGPVNISRRYTETSGADNDLDRYLYHDLKITLMDNDLPKVVRMTELAGVKVRFPFLDHKLVEFTGSIPTELKVHNGNLRVGFKRAFGKLLPPEILAKKKHGFGLPVARWMVRPGKLHDFVYSVLFDNQAADRGIFRPGFVENLYKRAKTDATPYYGTYLYYALFLELWLRENSGPVRET